MVHLDYLSQSHPWRQVKVGVKAGAAFAFFVAAGLWPNILVLLAIMGLSLWAMSRGPLFKGRHYLHWALVVGALLMISALSLMVVLPFSVRLDQAPVALRAFCRSFAMVHVLFAYVNCTPMKATLKALKRLGLPPLMASILETGYHFIFIFLEEARALYKSQTLRLGYGSRGLGLRSLGQMVALLLERVMLKTHQYERARALRGQGD